MDIRAVIIRTFEIICLLGVCAATLIGGVVGWIAFEQPYAGTKSSKRLLTWGVTALINIKKVDVGTGSRSIRRPGMSPMI